MIALILSIFVNKFFIVVILILAFKKHFKANNFLIKNSYIQKFIKKFIKIKIFTFFTNLEFFFKNQLNRFNTVWFPLYKRTSYLNYFYSNRNNLK